MVMVGRTVLRSLPVLVALFLAFFAAPVGVSSTAAFSTRSVPATALAAPETSTGSAVSGGFTAFAGPADVSGPEAVLAAGEQAEAGGRTAAASPAVATGVAAAGVPTATRARSALGASALTSQSTAGVAGSRAPPASV